MFRRRRRGARSTWFPVLPTEVGDENPTFNTSFSFVQEPQGTADNWTEAIAWPLINDTPLAAGATTEGVSLRDQVQGQTWRCDRIVGNIWCEYIFDGTGEGTVTAPRILCAAGIAVFPVDDEDPDVIELTNDEYKPFNANNSTNPWLWRRVWMLGAPNVYSGPEGAGSLRQDNSTMGTLRESSFVDTKGTKRVVQREQRMFAVFQFQDANIGGSLSNGSGNLPQVQWTYDLRVLGKLIAARNNSSWK